MMIPCEALCHLRLTIYTRLSAFVAADIQARVQTVHVLCPFEHFQLFRRIKCDHMHIFAYKCTSALHFLPFVSVWN